MTCLKKLFRRKWPKTLKITVHDGNCNLLDSTFISINSWNEVMLQGTQFANQVMLRYPSEDLDEVYWTYEEVV